MNQGEKIDRVMKRPDTPLENTIKMNTLSRARMRSSASDLLPPMNEDQQSIVRRNSTNNLARSSSTIEDKQLLVRNSNLVNEICSLKDIIRLQKSVNQKLTMRLLKVKIKQETVGGPSPGKTVEFFGL